MAQRLRAFLFCLIVVLAAAACARPQAPETGDKIQVVATTSIIGDVVKNVGGDRITLHILVPPGVDEHSFQYSPEDVARVSDADLFFLNSSELEPFARPLVEVADKRARIISLDEEVGLRSEPGSNQPDGDPHVWTDPANVAAWMPRIAEELARFAPDNAAEFQTNADAYLEKLAELDRWITGQVASIPVENRRLVTDHQMMTYFARRYGFEQVGAAIPSFSTVAEPSAQELAALEDAIRQYGVRAIFVGNTVNPSLARRLAADTGTKLVEIYSDSLSEAGGPASTYLDYMRYNVARIVEGLK